MSAVSLAVTKCPNDRLALTNNVFVRSHLLPPRCCPFTASPNHSLLPLPPPHHSQVNTADFGKISSLAARKNGGKQVDHHYVMTPKGVVYVCHGVSAALLRLCFFFALFFCVGFKVTFTETSS